LQVVEATTWTQIGIHEKRKPQLDECAGGSLILGLKLRIAVVLLNVLSFYEPFRQLIKNSIEAGFIQPEYEEIVIFVDGPENRGEHVDFDWGEAAITAIDNWRADRASKMPKTMFDWGGMNRAVNGQQEKQMHV